MQYVRTYIEGLNIIVDSTEDAHRVMRLNRRIKCLREALVFLLLAILAQTGLVVFLAIRLGVVSRLCR